jgi:hypothetical protein
MTSIKARQDVYALLTPEQRAKEKTEHDKVMQQHRMPARVTTLMAANEGAIPIKVTCGTTCVSSKHEHAVALSRSPSRVLKTILKLGKFRVEQDVDAPATFVACSNEPSSSECRL